jgi:hypothetical protein
MMTSEKPICIHRYLTQCATNPQPPGMADFIRGTIALFNYSQQYNFNILLDNTCHPIFAFLQNNHEYFINNTSIPVIELLSPISYAIIRQKLQNLFEQNASFSIITNSFYRDDNWGDITPQCQQFLQRIFTPTVDLQNYIDNVRINCKIPETYDIIHIRMGDHFLIGNLNHDDTFYMYSGKIDKILRTHPDRNFVLISDSITIARKLAEHHTTLTYWNNSKIHLGSLAHNWKKFDNNNIDYPSIRDTLADFFIMSKAQHIHSINRSGFNVACGLIFGIPIIPFS